MDPLTGLFVGGGLDLLSGFLQSDAQEDAAAAAAEAAAAAAGERRAGFENALPYRIEGYDQGEKDVRKGYRKAIKTLRGAAGPAPDTPALDAYYGEITGGYGGLQDKIRDTFETDPGYQFRLAEGQRALEQEANAGGQGRYSGATLQAINDYNQGMATNEFSKHFDRYNTYLGHLGTQAGRDHGSLEAYRDRKFRSKGAIAEAQIGKGKALGSFDLGRGDARYDATLGAHSATAEGIYGAGMAESQGYANQGNAWAGALSNLGQTVGYYGGNRYGQSQGNQNAQPGTTSRYNFFAR